MHGVRQCVHLHRGVLDVLWKSYRRKVISGIFFWLSFGRVEIKIVNDKGETVPEYERREIYVKTGVLFKEYCNDLGKT